jgi:adenylate cyclase
VIGEPVTPDPAGGAGSDAAGAQALEARRTKTAFLAHVRHELRTPLNAIIGYSEMLLEDLQGAAPEGFVADLQRVHRSGREALALVNEILDARKIEARAELDLQAFGAEIRHGLRTPLNAAIGYCELLLEDARNAGQQSAIPDLEKISTAGQRFLALIDDVVNVTQVKADGVELDLAPAPKMIREVVRAIRPLATDPAGPERRESGYLLVVDDNETNRDLLSRTLQRQGHRVVAAEGGRQALERLAGDTFDLVLLDIMMPDMNGFEVLERMKADAELRRLPVIMISALDELDSVVRAIEMGAEDYLPKPFNPVLLRARIEACLQQKRFQDREVMYLRQIEAEKRRADELLHVILPDEIVDELKATNAVKARRYANVAVLFCDVVGFTTYSEKAEPEQVLAYLQELVDLQEALALRYDLQKIKTIGDCFMAACGLLKPVPNPVLNTVRWGLDMVAAIPRLGAHWTVRVGIHAGPLVAGVVGHRQYLYDVFGDTVNTASRIESNGVPGRVAVSGAAWLQVADRCRGTSRGPVSLKGKGEMEVFLVDAVLEA